MLVLTRKNDQAVIIGDVDRPARILKVTVLNISGGSVRLGFEASRDVPVHREEVRERIVASRAREPPSSQSRQSQSNSADGNAPVLSGTGKGRSPKPSCDRA